MKPIEKLEKFQKWRDKLMHDLAERVCRPCTEPVKESVNLNYENPFRCGCRCDTAGNILSTVAMIDINIKKIKILVN